MVTKKEIIKSISKSVGCTQMQAKVAYEDLSQLIIEEMKNDGIIRLSGIGTLKSVQNRKRKGFEFSLSSGLKHEINDNVG